MATHETLGLILVRNGVLSRPQLYDALRLQRQTGRLLGTCLIELGYISSESLLQFLSQQLHAPICDEAAMFAAAPSAIERLGGERAWALLAVPFGWNGARLRLAVANGAILPRIGELAIELRCDIDPEVALETDVVIALKAHYPSVAPPAAPSTQPPPRTPTFGTSAAAPSETPQIRAEAGFWNANPTPVVSFEPNAFDADTAAGPLEDPLAPADVGFSLPAELPRRADPPSDPPLERLGLYDSVERVYEARSESQIGRCVGRALLNYFSRVLVLRVHGRDAQVVGHSGVMPQFSSLTLPGEIRRLAYGSLDEVVGAAELARELRIGRAATALLATVGRSLLLYGDNEALEDRYEELHDVEMLLKEADTALGLLNAMR